MKRNWEIIREILLQLEEASTPTTTLRKDSFEGFDDQEVAYNMHQLYEAGYIDGDFRFSNTGDRKITSALARRLKPKGHDLLDAMRNDSVWAKVKDTFATKGLDMTFDLVISVSKRVIEKLLD